MKKMLILGGSHRDIPLIETAKKMGMWVATMGDRPYYLGHRYADHAIYENFNDLARVKEIIKELRIDHVVPGSGEESYMRWVELSHQKAIDANCDELAVARIVHDKWKFKELCHSIGVSVPNGRIVNKSIDKINLDFPLILKPRTLSGGRGVQIVEDLDEYRRFMNQVNDENSYLAEEIVEGLLCAYSVVLKNQKVIYGFFGRDESYLNPFLVTTAYPFKTSEKVLMQLKEEVETIAGELSLVDGMFHLQVILDDEKAYIIDVTRRIPGDLYPWLMECCDGVEYTEEVIKAYIGWRIDEDRLKEQEKKFCVRHVVMPPKSGIYEGIQIDRKIVNQVLTRMDIFREGEKIENYKRTQLSIFIVRIDERQIEKVPEALKALVV